MTQTPGYKTPAFWLSFLVTMLGALTASGSDLVASGWGAQVLGMGVSALTAMGYTAWRVFSKPEAGSKPAWRTSEFWLTTGAVLVGATMTCGAFPDSGPVMQGLGLVATLLAGLGYAVPRKGPAPK
jgi:hypothetical protein